MTLQKIAKDVLGIPTLEMRNSDRLDFHSLAVFQIKSALQEAYKAGQASVTEQPLIGLISVLADTLKYCAEQADVAADAAANDEPNLAIGTLLCIDKKLPAAMAIFNAAMAIHQQGRRLAGAK